MTLDFEEASSVPLRPRVGDKTTVDRTGRIGIVVRVGSRSLSVRVGGHPDIKLTHEQWAKHNAQGL